MANKVDMIFWDVQHGNATYIRTPNGKHIVIDLGLGDYSGKNQQFSPLESLRGCLKMVEEGYICGKVYKKAIAVVGRCY